MPAWTSDGSRDVQCLRGVGKCPCRVTFSQGQSAERWQKYLEQRDVLLLRQQGIGEGAGGCQVVTCQLELNVRGCCQSPATANIFGGTSEALIVELCERLLGIRKVAPFYVQARHVGQRKHFRGATAILTCGRDPDVELLFGLVKPLET